MISSIITILTLIFGDKNEKSTYILLCIFLTLFLFSIVYDHLNKKKYPNSIDEIHINALDMIDQTFISNKHLKLLKAEVDVDIIDTDIQFTYRYFGTILEKNHNKQQGIYFNFSSESNDIQNPNHYFGYDLINDFKCEYPIEMKEISPLGMSKCLFFPFQKTLNKNETFNVEIHGTVYKPLPSSGRTYYFVKFSFNKKVLSKQQIDYTYCMRFESKPLWVKSNIINTRKDLIKLGNLQCQFDEQTKKYIYYDTARKSSVSYIHVYTFDRLPKKKEEN